MSKAIHKEHVANSLFVPFTDDDIQPCIATHSTAVSVESQFETQRLTWCLVSYIPLHSLG